MARSRIAFIVAPPLSDNASDILMSDANHDLGTIFFLSALNANGIRLRYEVFDDKFDELLIVDHCGTSYFLFEYVRQIRNETDLLLGSRGNGQCAKNPPAPVLRNKD